MKKYITLFVLLVSVGTYIGYLHFDKQQSISHPSTLKVSELLDELQSNEKNLNLNLMQLGYGIDNNYDKIVNTGQEIKTNIRLLSDHINKAPIKTADISTYLSEYESVNSIKMDLVESFKRSNSALLNSVTFAPFIGGVIAKELNQNNNDFDSNFIAGFNSELIRYIGFPNSSTLNSLKDRLSGIESIDNKYRFDDSIGTQINQYLIHVKHIAQHMEPTRAYLTKSTLVDTENSILKVKEAVNSEKAVLTAKLEQIGKLLTYYMAFLGLVVLGLLFKIRQLFLGKGSPAVQSLNEKITRISNQLETPLSFLGDSLDEIEASYKTLQSTIVGFDLLVDEAKKTEQNPKRLSAIVSKNLNDYVQLKSSGTLEKTDNMIKGSSIGLGEIANLISTLKAESDKGVAYK